MIEIDGAELTGGGQIIRTALALSAHTNIPFKIINIRAGRPRPGLMAQHLSAVTMMRELCNADVTGMRLGSEELTFVPHGFTPKPLDVHIGTAGAVTLLVQALTLPAMHHKKTTYTMHGGTDVRWAPPIDYLRYVIAPMLAHFGECKIELKRRGYYPKGAGQMTATLGQRKSVGPLTLIERGKLESITVVCNASQQLLDRQVCEDMERTIRFLLSDLNVPLTFRNEYANTLDPQFGVTCYATHSLGEPRILIGADILGDAVSGPQEAAEKVCALLKERLASEGAMDEHLADHLIPFIGIHGGEITVTRISNHIRANIAVTEQFTKSRFTVYGNHIRVSRQSSEASSTSV